MEAYRSALGAPRAIVKDAAGVAAVLLSSADRACARFPGRERQGELDRAPAAHFAVDPDAAAVGLYDAAADSESEAVALAPPAAFDPPIAAEEARNVFGSDTAPGVAHGDP